MTLLADPPVASEPTADDKVQNILCRLEHGEKLIQGQLKQGDNFCILGLFADESGLGYWGDAVSTHYYYMDGEHPACSDLPLGVMNYYNMRTCYGDFDPDDLTPELRDRLVGIVEDPETETSLMDINDADDVDPEVIKQLLIDIIKSRAIFSN